MHSKEIFIVIIGFLHNSVSGNDLISYITNSSDAGSRIVGGRPANEGSFPYTVAVMYKGSLICGGSLLTPSHLLTAAHCGIGRLPSDMSIRAGSLSQSSGGQVSRVSRIIVHPGYNTVNQDNDICIMELSGPVSISKNVGVVSLGNLEPLGGTPCTVSGWGRTREGLGPASSNLQYVNIPIVSRLQCKARYGIAAITDGMLCAGNLNGGQDACQGDSGGPLVLEGTNVQVGIVSKGIGCARPQRPGIYTNVVRYLPWVTEQTGKNLSFCDRVLSVCSRVTPIFICSILERFCSSL